MYYHSEFLLEKHAGFYFQNPNPVRHASSLRVFEFSPPSGDSGWNSQAFSAAGSVRSPGGEAATITSATFCYRIKFYRFLPTEYWVNAFEYKIYDRDSGCCELRSREWSILVDFEIFFSKFPKGR